MDEIPPYLQFHNDHVVLQTVDDGSTEVYQTPLDLYGTGNDGLELAYVLHQRQHFIKPPEEDWLNLHKELEI